MSQSGKRDAAGLKQSRQCAGAQARPADAEPSVPCVVLPDAAKHCSASGALKKIINKDIRLLRAVLYTMQDVCNTEQRRQWAQDRLWNMTQKITGMPGGHGAPAGLDGSFAAISEIEEQYSEKCAEYARELAQAEEIINAIPSREMQTFVVMKYVMDIPRKEIMARLNMKRWKFEKISACIEQAEDMAHVVLDERLFPDDNC